MPEYANCFKLKCSTLCFFALVVPLVIFNPFNISPVPSWAQTGSIWIPSLPLNINSYLAWVALRKEGSPGPSKLSARDSKENTICLVARLVSVISTDPWSCHTKAVTDRAQYLVVLWINHPGATKKVFDDKVTLFKQESVRKDFPQWCGWASFNQLKTFRGKTNITTLRYSVE